MGKENLRLFEKVCSKLVFLLLSFFWVCVCVSELFPSLYQANDLNMLEKTAKQPVFSHYFRLRKERMGERSKERFHQRLGAFSILRNKKPDGLQSNVGVPTYIAAS